MIRQNKKSQPIGKKIEQTSAVGKNCDEKETPMQNQTPDHQTLFTSIFADTYSGKEPSVSSSNRSDKRRLSFEAAIAGERAEMEIAARKRQQLDMKKGNLIY